MGYENAESYISEINGSGSAGLNNISASQIPMNPAQETVNDDGGGTWCPILAGVLAAGELAYVGIKVLGDSTPDLTGFWSINISRTATEGPWQDMYWGEVRQSDSSLSGTLDNKGYGAAKYQLTGTVDNSNVNFSMSAQYLIHYSGYYYTYNTTTQCSMTRSKDYLLSGTCNETTTAVKSNTGATYTYNYNNLTITVNIVLQDN